MSTAVVPHQHQQHHAEHFDCGDAADICCNNNKSSDSRGGRKRALVHRSSNKTTRQHPQLPPGVLDPYQVLAVRRDATASEVKHSYARLALLHHPQRKLRHDDHASNNNNNSSISAQFAILAACYETLTNSTVRKRLDDLLYDNNHNSTINQHAAPPPVYSRSGHSSVSAPTTPKKNRKQASMIQPHSISVASSGTNTPSNHNLAMEQQQNDEPNFDETSHSNLQEDEPQRSNVVDSPLSVGSSMVESGPANYNDDDDNGEIFFDCDWRDRNDSFDDADDADIKSNNTMASSSIISMVQRPPSPPFACACPNNDSGDGGRHYCDPTNAEDPYNESTNYNDASRPTASSHHSFVGGKSPSMMMTGSTAAALPALLKASTSTETTGDDVHHYSEAATERLFGGPLQLMFRARRWQPFTDPYAIFQRVFKSSLLGNSNTSSNTASNTAKPTAGAMPPQAAISANHFHHHGAAANFTSETKTLPDGRVVHRNTKLLPHHVSIVRTVTRFSDPVTGHTRTTIEVTSTPTSPDPRRRSPATTTHEGGWCGRMILCGGGGCAGGDPNNNELLLLEDGEPATGKEQPQQQQQPCCGHDDAAATQATVPVDDDEWSFGSTCLAWLPSCV